MESTDKKKGGEKPEWKCGRNKNQTQGLSRSSHQSKRLGPARTTGPDLLGKRANIDPGLSTSHHLTYWWSKIVFSSVGISQSQTASLWATSSRAEQQLAKKKKNNPALKFRTFRINRAAVCWKIPDSSLTICAPFHHLNRCGRFTDKAKCTYSVLKNEMHCNMSVSHSAGEGLGLKYAAGKGMDLL